MNMKHNLKLMMTALLLTAVMAFARQNDKKDADAPTSPEAVRALEAYARAEQKAQAQYVSALRPAREKLLTALKAAKDKATKNGKLDEAVRLRDLIAATQADGVNPPRPANNNGSGGGRTAAALAKALAGSQWKKMTDGGNFTLTLHPDMSTTASHHRVKGTWAAVDGRTVRISASMHDSHGVVLRVTNNGSAMINAAGETDLALAGK